MFGLQSLSGSTLGQYELRDLLGSGGMGAVYLGYQAALERLVAIKVLNFALITDPDYLARFTREAKTSASLEHPHIVPVYDYGTQNGISFVVMRYLTGGSLAERLDHSAKTGRPLPSLSEISQIIRQLASALDYAHERGVIHRDVKTNNVMFDNQGTAFLVDFGIAKLTHSTSALTGTGMSVGTPSYMSPEQWRGETVTPAADQYALAVTAYAMLTGRLPFEAETPFALMHKHLNEMPTPLHAFRADLPDGVRDVLSKALSKAPDARYESTSAFARELDQAVQGKSGAPTGFFLTPLPPKPKVELLDHPTVTPAPAPVQTPGKTFAEIPPVALPLFDDTGSRAVSDLNVSKNDAATEDAPRRPVAGGLMIFGALLIAAVVVALIIFAVRQYGEVPDPIQVADNNGDGRVTLTSQPPTATEDTTSAALAGAANTETSTRTQTEVPSPTNSATSTSTETATPEPSPTATSTQTLTTTPTPTFTETPTLSVRGAALATRDAFSTATATLWTITPTPDMNQTLAAELTALQAEDLTATATLWTATATQTPSATATETETPSETPTNTPMPTLTSTSTRTLAPIVTAAGPSQTPPPVAECPGIRPSRLTVGMEGYVLQDDARALNVRRGSGTSFSTLTQLQIGETFTVLDGPVCGDNFAWLRIEARSGAVIGWVAEGDDEAYFVAPVEMLDPLTTFDLKPDCQIVLQDDFEDETSPNNWFTDSNARYVVDIFNGAYNLQINFLRDGSTGDPQGEGAPILWGSLSDYTLTNGTAEAVITSSLFADETDVRTGLWLRYQDEQNFLAFMIRGDGSYRIARYQDGVFIDLVDWTQNGAINTGDGATNTLRVELADNSYTLYINGQFMATATDSTWAEGRVAFWGASPRTPVTFALDYFRVCAN